MMRTVLQSFMTVTLFLATTAASAQCAQALEDHMDMLIAEILKSKVEVTKSLSLERDVQKEGAPMQWRCDVFQFSLPKKKRDLMDRMVKTFEEESHDNPNCYGVNSMSESSNGDTFGHSRNLMIGEDPNRYVTIGKDYNNFLNINILDVADSTKTHRYAYALEWRDGDKGKTDVRYIITYAKIPSATATITQPSWPYLFLGRSRIPKNGPIQAESKARAYWLGKDYPVESIDSLVREARNQSDVVRKQLDDALKQSKKEGQRQKKSIEIFHQKYPKVNVSAVAWNDTLQHEYDPVTDVVARLHQGQPVSSADLLCNDNILLIFSQLKQQLLAGQNTEFNAISIYTLCKRAREYGFFTHHDSKAELEQLKDEVMTLYNKIENKSCERYLQMAFDELEKIQ